MDANLPPIVSVQFSAIPREKCEASDGAKITTLIDEGFPQKERRSGDVQAGNEKKCGEKCEAGCEKSHYCSP